MRASPRRPSQWFLAEGATGPFFDLFVLVANPTSAPASVEVRYLRSDGAVLTDATIAGRSRATVWVDLEGPELATAEVSTVVRSTNGVRIVVERAMWWPGAPSTWHEGHVSQGATSSATRWALAEGAVETASPGRADTYILVANVGAASESVSVQLLFEDRPPVSRTFEVGPNSRFTIGVANAFPEAWHRRFGAVVSGARGQPLVVEAATYSDAAGVIWAAGSSLLATPIR